MANYWQKLQTGGYAQKVFNSGTAKDSTNAFYCVRVLTDTVFADLSSTTITNVSDLVGPTIPAGTELLGEMTDIDLTSGLIEAFSDSELS